MEPDDEQLISLRFLPAIPRRVFISCATIPTFILRFLRVFGRRAWFEISVNFTIKALPLGRNVI